MIARTEGLFLFIGFTYGYGAAQDGFLVATITLAALLGLAIALTFLIVACCPTPPRWVLWLTKEDHRG